MIFVPSKSKRDRNLHQARAAQCGSQASLLLGVEEQEAAAARADQLAADRAVVERELVPAVDLGVGHQARALLLELPVLVHEAAERVELAGLDRLEALVAELFDVVQVVDHRAIVLAALVVLLLQHLRRRPVEARRHHHQAVLEQVQRVVARLDRPRAHRVVLVELEHRRAAERRDVLVLLADRLLQQIDLDVAGHLGQLARVHEVPLELVQHAQQASAEAARRPEAGAGRDVGHAGDLDVTAGDAGQAQRLADDRVLDVVDLLDALDLRVAQDDLFERGLHQRHVDVLVDRGGHQEPAVLPVVRGQVGAAAAEGDAKRAASDDHFQTAKGGIEDGACWQDRRRRASAAAVGQSARTRE